MIVKVLTFGCPLSLRKTAQHGLGLILTSSISFVNIKICYPPTTLKICSTLVNSVMLQHSITVIAIQTISSHGIVDLARFSGPQITNSFAPFLNATSYHLMSWFYNLSSSKSLSDLDRLVNDVIFADDFNRDDLQDFSAACEAKRMDASSESIHFSAVDGWHLRGSNLIRSGLTQGSPPHIFASSVQGNANTISV